MTELQPWLGIVNLDSPCGENYCSFGDPELYKQVPNYVFVEKWCLKCDTPVSSDSHDIKKIPTYIYISLLFLSSNYSALLFIILLVLILQIIARTLCNFCNCSQITLLHLVFHSQWFFYCNAQASNAASGKKIRGWHFKCFIIYCQLQNCFLNILLLVFVSGNCDLGICF